MIDRFSKQRFEAALPVHKETGQPLWYGKGLQNGEEEYAIPVNEYAKIVVRSSIDKTGMAAETGEDSIRLWVEIVAQHADGSAAGWRRLPKIDAWTTRVNGWEKRMTEKVRELWSRVQNVKRAVPVCEKCGQIQPVWLIKAGPNAGKLASKCIDDDTGFVLLEVAECKAESVPSAKAATVSPTTSSTAEMSGSAATVAQGSVSGKDESIASASSTTTLTSTMEDDLFSELAAVVEGALKRTDDTRGAKGPNTQQQAAIEAPIDAAVRVLAGPGSGKCLGRGTPVLMYSGQIKLVEDIVEGDLLMGPDSQPRIVLRTTRGFDRMVRVIPTKGDSWTCNMPHILSVVLSGKRYPDTPINVSVEDFLTWSKGLQKRAKLWRTGISFIARTVPIDPYLFGIWLGDGDSHRFAITTPDEEIVETIFAYAEANGYQVTRNDSNGTRCPNYNLTGGAINLLREIDVLNNKHIPEMYMINDQFTRASVLAGLLDTDGYYSKGCYEIVQKREEMAIDILYLARSLGLAAYMSHKFVNEELYYRIYISGNLSILPLRLARKRPELRKQIKQVARTGFSIEALGVDEYFGFTLSGDGLFLLGDFTVTHNTYVIERRYAYLIANGVDPRNILAVTFSAPMAQDLRERILRLNPEVAASGADSQICTIHAACNRILQAERKGRNVAKQWQVKKALQEIVPKLWPGGMYNQRPSWDEVLNIIANAKHHALRPGPDYEYYNRIYGDYHAGRLQKARVLFDTALRSEKLWTFTDMLYDCEILLQDDDLVCDKYQQKYQYVIIDEGQDTNGQAMRILATLAQPQNRLFIVGDPDQLLYRFTGATPEANLYDGFTQRYTNQRMYMLETNYRSTAEIVQRSNFLIRYNYADAGGPYDEMYRKELNAKEEAASGRTISFVEYKDQQQEAEGAVEQIKHLLNEGREPGDIFVCSRTRAQLGFLEGPLTRAGIKFINITGGSFWSLKHVADVLGYVRLALNHEDSASFKRVYNIASNKMVGRDKTYCTTRWLGRAFLEDVNEIYDEDALMAAANARFSYERGVYDLIDFMQALEHELDVNGLSAALRYVIDECYAKYLKEEEGITEEDVDSSKLADLETVIEISKAFPDAVSFLARVDEALQAAQDAKDKKWDQYVVLSTIHRLKGMERPVVLGLGWSEGEVSNGDFTTPCGLLPHTFSLIAPMPQGILDRPQKSLIEDERCMAFVAITRAKEEVYLSGIRVWRKANMWPSRFVRELGL